MMVVSYVRLSVADIGKGDKESQSIINQIQFIHDYAKKNNIQIFDDYIDEKGKDALKQIFRK